ncbi:hypothetical protein [Citrobacter freundii]|uniref:Uncharacterized protein n=1 Tax=Citrobacter freundii TaxID=546 RepID=A0A7G2IRF9_CITFR|nr:hypothetical protein [Citrobacter freundii]
MPVIPETYKDALSVLYTCFDSWDVDLFFKIKTLSSLKKYLDSAKSRVTRTI